MAAKASPTGLLPIWNKWINKGVVNKYGFSYSVAKAKATLAAAGYKDTNGDGYVENKDGSAIDLKLAVPNGWSDWMTATQVISDSAKAVGIKVTPEYPRVRHAGRRPRARATSTSCSATTSSSATRRGRTTSTSTSCPSRATRPRPTTSGTRDQSAWNLTQKLEQDAVGEHAAYQSVMTQLETTFLQNLPAIPLWYNGMWAMYNTKYWTNWPSVDGPASTRPARGGTTSR